MTRAQSNTVTNYTDRVLYTVAMADSKGMGGGGRPPPIDWIHLKTSENLAPECMIFA